MRRGLILIALLGLVACQPPSERLLQQKSYALEVDFQESLPGLSDTERAELHSTYETAIRARLKATYGEPVSVLSAPEGCPVIKVEVDSLQLAAYPPKGGLFKAWLADSVVSGVLDHLTHNPSAEAAENGRNNSYLDRYIDRKVETRRLDRLGYLPLLVKGRLTYLDTGRTYSCVLDGEHLLTLFRPLAKLDNRDQGPEIRTEEARVLAEAVAGRLVSRGDWTLSVNR